MSAEPGSTEGTGGHRAVCTECPLCAGRARRVFTAVDLNRCVGRERFQYARCSTCHTYFLLAVPPDISRYYPTEYYGLSSLDELERLAATQLPYVEMILRRTAPGRLLEIGPGEGVFARAASNAGFRVTAIEMDGRACDHLRTVVGVEAIQSATPEEVLPTLEPSRAIVMWQVIEHLSKPWDVIEQAALNLEPGGVLVVATPNPQALQFRLLGARWAHLDAPRHLFLIPSTTLALRCSRLGLRQVSSTTADLAGLHWNRFGWDYALRPAPRSRPAGLARRALSALLARTLAPIETRGRRGCSYTSVFVKQNAS
jgi:SAM-dependent methyltransferase